MQISKSLHTTNKRLNRCNCNEKHGSPNLDNVKPEWGRNNRNKETQHTEDEGEATAHSSTEEEGRGGNTERNNVLANDHIA